MCLTSTDSHMTEGLVNVRRLHHLPQRVVRENCRHMLLCGLSKGIMYNPLELMYFIR